MVNYQNGKIYKLESKEGKCMYIGSTCRKLNARLRDHKSDFKRYEKTNHYVTSFEILKYTDFTISLIEAYPCNNVSELRRKEGEYIKKFDCVNQTIAGRTYSEWYNTNKEKILKYRKKYYNENKDKSIKDVQKYYQKNKQSKILYASEYRETNKEKLKNIASSRIMCICGMDIRFGDRRRHEKTKYHLSNIKI